MGIDLALPNREKLEVHCVLNRLRYWRGSWLSFSSKYDSQRFGQINLSSSRVVISLLLMVSCQLGRAIVDRICPTCSLLVAPTGCIWQGQWGFFWHQVCINESVGEHRVHPLGVA